MEINMETQKSSSFQEEDKLPLFCQNACNEIPWSRAIFCILSRVFSLLFFGPQKTSRVSENISPEIFNFFAKNFTTNFREKKWNLACLGMDDISINHALFRLPAARSSHERVENFSQKSSSRRRLTRLKPRVSTDKETLSTSRRFNENSRPFFRGYPVARRKIFNLPTPFHHY